MTQPPTFSALSDLLRQECAGIDPSELQGSLCAQLSAGREVSPVMWLGNALGSDEAQADFGVATRSALDDLYNWTTEALNDPQLGFTLFLPDDESELSARTEALTQWCNGFLSGLGMAGLSDVDALPEDAREYVVDLREIAKAGFDVDDADDEDEVAFCELVEYARIGMMLMYETLRGPEQHESVH